MIKLHNNLDNLGFENSFVKNYKKLFQNSIENFNKFIKQPIKKILKIIP